MITNILTTTSRVETPFIIVDVNGYAFGTFSKKLANVTDSDGVTRKYVSQYPNFVKSLEVNKVNGTVNTYTITLVYAVRSGDDPNMIDKIFSSVSKSRKIKISYGDYSSPNFIYKDEEALITNITTDVDMMSSVITYVISATGAGVQFNSGNYTFPSVNNRKPSDVLLNDILYSDEYGVTDVFNGMRDRNKVETRSLILIDDAPVSLPAKTNMTVFEYINYLVGSMSCKDDEQNSITNRHRYILTIEDDKTGYFGGVYFKISKVEASSSVTESIDTFEVDVGYPSNNIVVDFKVNDNQTYALLYDYAMDTNQSNYVYRIDNNGELIPTYSPKLSNSDSLYLSTPADKNWYSQVTQYPITATLKLKGLLRPAMLMTYIKVNVIFFGQKHLTSGTYIITKQTDSVSESGYMTTLGLTRVSGE